VAEALEAQRGAQPHQRRRHLARIPLLEQRPPAPAIRAHGILEGPAARVAGHLRDPAEPVNEIDHAPTMRPRPPPLGVDRHQTGTVP